MNTTTAIRPLPSARMPSALRIYLLEAGYEFLRLLRTPAFAIPTIAFPAVFYAIFGLLIPGQWGGYQKALYLLANYGVFGIMGPALFGFGVSVAMERQSGWLELKRVSPMPPGAYLFAKLAMALLFGFLVVLVLGVLAIGLGGVRIDAATALHLLAVLMLGIAPFCALGLWMGSLARGQAAVAIVNLVYLPMSVLSGLWMPLFVFPMWLQKLAVVFPAWHLSQLALGAVGQIQNVRHGLHVGVLLATTALFLSLAARRLRKE